MQGRGGSAVSEGPTTTSICAFPVHTALGVEIQPLPPLADTERVCSLRLLLYLGNVSLQNVNKIP